MTLEEKDEDEEDEEENNKKRGVIGLGNRRKAEEK